VKPEGASVLAPASERPSIREGLTDRSFANLYLLYQGVRIPPRAPSCRVPGQRAAP
jgi:hypothetical protein